MADIKRTVTIDYKINGLDTAKKNIDTLKVNLGGTDQIEDLERQTKDLAILMAKIPEGMTEGPLIDEVNERYTKLLKGIEKARIAMLNLVDPEVAPTLDDLNNQLEEVDEKLLQIAKDKTAIEKKYLVGVEGTGKDEITTTKSARKEALGQAKNALTEDQQMLSVGGRKMSDAYAYLDTFKKYKEVLDSADVKQAEILEKLEAGKNLTKEEKGILSENLKANEYIKLNADQINEQYKIRRTLLDVEQDIHKEARETGLAILDDKKYALEIQKEAIEINKKDVEKDIGDTKFSKEAEDILKSNTDAQIEHIKAQEEAKKKAIELEKQQKAEEKQRKKLEAQQKKNIKGTEKETTTLGKAAKQVFSYGVAFNALRKIYRETIKTITDLDKALTEMSVVTSMNRKESWNLIPTFQELAKETGFTTTEIAKLSTEYFRQGRELKDVIELTTVAAKAARIAGISAQESANYLTSAVNGFGLAASEALAVSDRFAALAASSASSYEELAVGLSKFAAQARVAGLSIDFAMGMLAKGVETTREAPETIGTAIKTVLSRMRELTDYGKTLEDGMDMNRVDAALKQVGISLTDNNGKFRDMEDVIKEVGSAWDGLNRTQQASVAVALAGTRQQSRLISIFNDFDRTLELVNTSQDSAGATAAQHAEYMKSMEAAMTALNTAWQKFITTITDSELIIGVVRGIGNTIDFLAVSLDKLGVSGKNAMIMIGLLAAGLKGYSMITTFANSQLGISLGLKKSGLLVDALTIMKGKETIAEKIEMINLLIVENQLNKKNNQEKRKSLLSTIKESAANIWNALTKKTQIAATGAQTVATGAQATATGTATAAQWGLNAAMMANPIGLVVAGILLLVGALALFVKGMDDVKKGNDTVAASFTNMIMPLIDSLKNLWNIFVDLIKVVVEASMTFNKLSLAWAPLKFWFGYLKMIFEAWSVAFKLLASGLKWIQAGFNSLISAIPGLKGLTDFMGSISNWSSGIINKFKEWGKAIDEWGKKADRENKKTTMSYEELAKSIEKAREANQVENFNLNKENKEITGLIDEYERLNKLKEQGLATEEDLLALETAKENIVSYNEGLDEKDKFITYEGGEINWDTSVENLDEIKKENIEAIRENLRESAEAGTILAEKDIDKFLKGEGSGLKDTLDYLLFEATDGGEMEISDAQRKFLENYYANVIEATGEVDLDKLEGIDYEFLIENVEDFENKLENSSGTLAEKTKIFQKTMEGLSGAELKAFKETYPEYVQMLDLFGEDLEKYGKMFDELGVSPEILKDIAETGADPKEVMDELNAIYEELDDVPEELRMTAALAKLAEQTRDSDLAMVLLNTAMKKGTLELTQNMDAIESKIKNVNEAQDKFLKGEMSDSDFFQFVEENADLFADEEFFEDFMNGADLTKYTLKQQQEAFNDYKKQLMAVDAQIAILSKSHKKEDKEKLKSLEVERRRLLALTTYTGALTEANRTQTLYNNTLRAYNNLKKLGIVNLELEQKMVTRYIKVLSNEMYKSTEDVRKLFEYMENEGLSKYLTIVDGVYQLTDGFYELSKAEQDALLAAGDGALEKYLDKANLAMDGVLEQYSTLMEASIAIEEEATKKKKKIYEDYFKALDKMEERRQRKQSREDLVKQLQRLQGATDEASRKRAIELRKELNQLDEDTIKDETAEAREAILGALDKELEDFIEAWKDGWLDFIETAEDFGEDIGLGLLTVLEGAGLIPEGSVDEYNKDKKTEENKNKIDHSWEQTKPLDQMTFAEWEEAISKNASLIGKAPKQYHDWVEAGRPQNVKDLIAALTHIDFSTPTPTGGGGGGGSSAGRTWAQDGPKLYKKGGLVDYTGIAKVHGSSRNPEMVLDAQQTQMFFGLRDALASLAFEGKGGDGGISIENITIQTNELNNNQDFANAGKVLATEFKKAISRRGISINAKK